MRSGREWAVLGVLCLVSFTATAVGGPLAGLAFCAGLAAFIGLRYWNA